MAIVTGDRYLEKLVKFVDTQAGPLIESALVLKLNPVGLHYVQSRLESLQELERLLSGAPVDYLRAYVSDLGDYRALEQLRRILRLLTSLKVVSVLPPPARDPTPLSLLPFGRLRFLELRGCDLSTSAGRGLLELRHTLEKLICHNSTDALRHIFASRIVEIKDSPQWSRLSFVSCPCNGLVLMDESLQLLPAVETLDLSRNKFSKVDNLWKCMKLKHLDLGFNNLRTIEPCSKVKCHIVKLVLRNNALTTLRGIENLKSLEELDISYNIISNFSELEILAGLPLLVSLWLEGNPICCARWYRPQVFSLFPYFHKLKLDDKAISTREYWKRQFIIARRQKQPASFGFYSPAKNDAEGEGNLHRKKKKQSRLASIESEEESILLCSDQDSLSCENEIQSKEDNVGPDDEAEIVDLINKVELLKKERSTLWLREFKEWMDQDPQRFLDNGPLETTKESYLRDKTCQRQCGEISQYVLDSVQASGDESSTNFVEYDSSFADTSVPFHSHQYSGQISFADNNGLASPTGPGRVDNNQENPEFNLQNSIHGLSKHIRGSHWGRLTSERQRMAENLNALEMRVVEDTMDTHSSSGYPESPPHYQEDILHRRHNLVEEILQLSAESYSVASTDSDTSCSEDEFRESETLGRYIDLMSNEESSNWNLDRQPPSNTFLDRCCNSNNKQLSPRFSESGLHCGGLSNGETSSILESASQFFCKHTQGYDDNVEIANPVDSDLDQLEKRRVKKKPVKRSIALVQENDTDGKSGKLDESCVMDAYNQGHQQEKQSQERDGFIEDYFKTNIARSNETSRQYLRCGCVLEQESIYREREVAVILSSTHRLYVLLVGIRFDGSGAILNTLGCHMIEDVREISFGMGLQAIRVCIDNGARYLFITRSIDRSRKLLGILQIIDSFATKCRLKSLEDVQVELFSKQICSGAVLNIFQYSMVLFWRSNNEKSWVLRSLFVAGGQLLVCFEDIRQFSSLPKASSSRPYFSLVSCCSVADVIEMVIEGGDSPCVTLYVENAASEFCPAVKAPDKASSIKDKSSSSDAVTWKLKWFSENGLSQFVTLLRALHSMTSTPLFVRCIS